MLLAECDLPDTLRRYKYVDFREERKAAFDELVAACREEVETPLKPQAPLAVFVRELTGHGGWVYSIAVSPDGTWAASGSKDKTVKIWDLATGQCRLTLTGHTNEVNSVAIMPDGKQVLSGADDGTIRLWDAASESMLALLRDRGAFVRSAVALSDGRRVLFGGTGCTIDYWELATKKRGKTLRGHQQ